MNDKQARIGITLGDPAEIGHRREGHQRDKRRDAGATLVVRSLGTFAQACPLIRSDARIQNST